jgi:hypothetical protein
MKFETTITLPKELLSEGNKTDHWSKKYKRNKLKDNYLIAYCSNINITLPALIKITRIAPRALDFDNLHTTMKHYIDFLSSKLIPGLRSGRADSDPRLKFELLQEKGKVRQYSLKIEITTLKIES